MEEATKEEAVVPKFGSLEWNDYVMSQFTPDEIFEENPKVDGLWRVTELVLGTITDYSADVRESPSDRNDYCSTVQVDITVKTKDGFLSSSGVGDCSKRNADPTYARFPSSLAETRAKARALRTVLRLRNVVAAEELTKDLPDESEELCTDNQVSQYDVLCNKLDINPVKLLMWVCGEISYSFKTVSRTHKSVFSKCFKELAKYQNDKSKIPVDFKGYKKEWKR